VPTSTNRSQTLWDFRRLCAFTAAILLILGLDIALAFLIYLIAHTFW